MALVNTYKELDVWKLAIKQCVFVYKLTCSFPKDEKFGLSSQMKRASVSVPSNLAEGFNRCARKENMHFVSISQGSNAELETQIIICKELGLIDKSNFDDMIELNNHIGKMLTRYYQSLSK